MQEIIIDEEFRSLLPVLDTVTFESLEKSLLTHGARDPLVLWDDSILIDGYNRYKICMNHDIPFTTVSMEFDSRDEVLVWIIENQVSRRNLTPIELNHFRGLYYNAAKRISSSNNQYTVKSARPQNEGEQSRSSTAREVGKRFNVSKATIERDGMIANAISAIAEISPEAKRKILSGEVAVDRSNLQRLSKAPISELEEAVNQINAGTYNRNDYRIRKTPETTQAPGNASGIPTPPTHTEATYVDTIVSLITGNFNSTLKSLNNESGLPELRSSLRTFINNLEELYSNIAAAG